MQIHNLNCTYVCNFVSNTNQTLLFLNRNAATDYDDDNDYNHDNNNNSAPDNNYACDNETSEASPQEATRPRQPERTRRRHATSGAQQRLQLLQQRLHATQQLRQRVRPKNRTPETTPHWLNTSIHRIQQNYQNPKHHSIYHVHITTKSFCIDRN